MEDGRLLYKGPFKNGLYNGYGEEYTTYNNSDEYSLSYRGEFKDGKWEGTGTEYYIMDSPDGSKTEVKKWYTGEFHKGKYNGKGKLFDYYGNITFNGTFKNNYKLKGIEYNEYRYGEEVDYRN